MFNVYWRESCTDPTWKDPNCVKLFITGKYNPGGTMADPEAGANLGVLCGATENGDSDARIWPCNDGSFCHVPGKNDTAEVGEECCRANRGFFLDENNEQTSINPNASTSASTSISSPTSTSGTGEPADSEDDGMPLSSRLGLGLGLGLGTVGIAAAAVLWFLQRRKATRYANVDSKEGLKDGRDYMYRDPPSELDSFQPRAELDGQSPKRPAT
jgi:hypothetical protein